jgi:hypothetical protein
MATNRFCCASAAALWVVVGDSRSNGVGFIAYHAGFDQGDDIVGNHPRVNAEAAVIGQRCKNRRGQAADAVLNDCAVFDDLA